jgi:hypothetical protein
MDTSLRHVFVAIVMAAYVLTLNIILTINGFYDNISYEWAWFKSG